MLNKCSKGYNFYNKKKERITKFELQKYLGKSHFNKKAKEIGNKKYWGNHDLGFVGYIGEYNKRSALQWKYEGYGVHEKPISEIYYKYGIDNRIINKFNWEKYNLTTPKEHLTFILEKLNNGNFIQLWGDLYT